MDSDAHLILHKTDKAFQELRQRTYGLNPRVRQILILIDGRRSCRELARMMPDHELAQCVRMLQEQGFVRQMPAAGASAPSGAGPTAPPAASDSHPPQDIRAVQRRVVRLLLDSIGPHGDELAIRIERSRSLDELRALLPAAASVVEAVAGRTASLRFLERIDGLRSAP
jgi:hypothetical protein